VKIHFCHRQIGKENVMAIEKITDAGVVDFGGQRGPQEPIENPNDSYPTPPPIPEVDRETGAVQTMRTEDVGQLDGWENSTEPLEGHDWNNGPDYCRPNKKPSPRYFGDDLRHVI
jgi:hypothetical protein